MENHEHQAGHLGWEEMSNLSFIIFGHFPERKKFKVCKNNIVLVFKIISKGEFTGTSIVQTKKLILVEILLLSFLF